MPMQPKLLMLDEPAAGLSPVNVDKLLETVLALKQRYGLTLIIIEHILKVVMEAYDIVTVLEHGEKIAEGPLAQIDTIHGTIVRLGCKKGVLTAAIDAMIGIVKGLEPPAGGSARRAACRRYVEPQRRLPLGQLQGHLRVHAAHRRADGAPCRAVRRARQSQA